MRAVPCCNSSGRCISVAGQDDAGSWWRRPTAGRVGRKGTRHKGVGILINRDRNPTNRPPSRRINRRRDMNTLLTISHVPIIAVTLCAVSVITCISNHAMCASLSKAVSDLFRDSEVCPRWREGATGFSERRDEERHLDTIFLATFDHGAHDPGRETDDFRLVGRQSEPEILEQGSGEGLQFDNPVDGLVSPEKQCKKNVREAPSVIRFSRQREFGEDKQRRTRCIRARQRLGKISSVYMINP